MINTYNTVKSPWYTVRTILAIEALRKFIKDATGEVDESMAPFDLLTKAFAIAQKTPSRKWGNESRGMYCARMLPLLGLPAIPKSRPKDFVDPSFVAPIITEREKVERRIKSFYKSKKWLTSKARYVALVRANGRCQCCGATTADGVRLVVDHIKPIRKYWDLRFDENNTQVLCYNCNLGKGSWDETDWRSGATSLQDAEALIRKVVKRKDGVRNALTLYQSLVAVHIMHGHDFAIDYTAMAKANSIPGMTRDTLQTARDALLKAGLIIQTRPFQPKPRRCALYKFGAPATGHGGGHGGHQGGGEGGHG